VAVVVVHLGTAAIEWLAGYEDLVSALFLGRSPRFRVDVGGQQRLLVEAGEVWRLWTSVFLHGDALHLAVNAVALGSIGRLLEPWIGGLRLWSWFLIGGVVGAALSQAIGLVQSDGASGGAFALLGATALVARRQPERTEEERRTLGPWLWGFIAVNLVTSFALPFVNAASHLGGLAAGVALGALWRRPWEVGTAAHALWLALGAAIGVWGAQAVLGGIRLPGM
jgi:MYXO-CTERM domain-containing protein